LKERRRERSAVPKWAVRLAHGERSHATCDTRRVRGYFRCAHRRTSFPDPSALIIFRNAGLRSPCASRPFLPLRQSWFSRNNRRQWKESCL
jgi:hypothetical protein